MPSDIIDPHVDVWPFVTKLWFVPDSIDNAPGNDIFEIDQSVESVITDNDWLLVEPDDIGMFIRVIPDWERDIFFNGWNVWIIRVQTKGGVILKEPMDIMNFFAPDYNKSLEEERMRRLSHC